MRSKKRTGASAGDLSQCIQNLPHQPKVCLEGESLGHFLKSIQREIESVRALDATLPPKIWTKQQFAVGVNEVTRALERMPLNHGNNLSSEEHFPVNRDDAKASGVYLQAILLASDCYPRSLIKHLPALAASRNVPIISIKDRKEASVRLGELIKLKTAITIGIKAKGNAVNQLIVEALKDNEIESIEA